jgi:hypothetical protein
MLKTLDLPKAQMTKKNIFDKIDFRLRFYHRHGPIPQYLKWLSVPTDRLTEGFRLFLTDSIYSTNFIV